MYDSSRFNFYEGQLASVISIISIGIGIVALPAGILAAGYSEAVRRRRAHFKKLVEDVMEYGVITADEERVLKDTQQTLGLCADEAEIILDTSRTKRKEKESGNVVNSIEKEMKIALNNQCPHCDKAVDWRVEKRKK